MAELLYDVHEALPQGFRTYQRKLKQDRHCTGKYSHECGAPEMAAAAFAQKSFPHFRRFVQQAQMGIGVPGAGRRRFGTHPVTT